MTLGSVTSPIGNFGKYGANLLVITFMVGVQFLMTFLLVSEPEHPDRKENVWVGFRKFPQVVATSVQYGVKNPVVFLLLLTTLAWGLGVSGVELFWQPQLKTILGSDSQTWVFGLLAAGYFFAASMGNVLSTPMCKLLKSNYPLVLFINRLLMGVFLFVLSLQFGIGGFVVFYLAFFLVNGAAESPFLAIFNAQVPGRTRSTLLSFGSLVLQLGGMGGSLFLGYLAKAFSISLAWTVGAGILAASSILYLFLSRAERAGQRHGSQPAG
jgi:predicted MFS family arabinose efflux permease